ncbi:MAG: tRNA pseudouridine(38-40) synthase TruA [Anaerolineae bacterium]|nr:tRNA pseudouridine(38-40) synthase TruA [Anaerolineae bacterium]
MRVKAVVAYDGTGYGGYQIQKNAPTIQGELESALAQLAGASVRTLAAGRTDAGVHAVGQVIAFDLEWRHSLEGLQRGLNAVLPAQISILDLQESAPGFHPRYDARRRWYRYRIYRGATRHPFYQRFYLHVSRSLSIVEMQAAAQMLVGRQDFYAFGSPPQGDNAIREVFRADWREEEELLRFDIEADAFLFRMVRMLVGTLLRVGRGDLDTASFAEILRTRDRRRAGPAVPASGLTLMGVTY